MKINTINKSLFVVLSALVAGVAYSDTSPIVVPSIPQGQTVSADTLANLQSQIAVLKAQAEVNKLKSDIDKAGGGGGLTGSLGLPPMPDVNQGRSYSGWKLPDKPGSIPEAARAQMEKNKQSSDGGDASGESSGGETHHYSSNSMLILAIESYNDEFTATAILGGKKTIIHAGDKFKISNNTWVVKKISSDGVLMSYGHGKPFLYTVESY